jgi:cold shock CspA family protein
MNPPEGFLGTIADLSETHWSGTIQPDRGGEPLQFHKSAVEATTIKGLRRGARVSYRTIEGINGRSNATAILVL